MHECNKAGKACTDKGLGKYDNSTGYNYLMTAHTVNFDWFLFGVNSYLGVLLTKTFDILPEIIIEYQI